MCFAQMYAVAWSKSQSDKQRELIDELTRSDLHRDYLNIKSTRLERDPVSVRTNGSYPSEPKPFVPKVSQKENTFSQPRKSDQSIDDLTRKLETLTLTINALSEKVAEREQSGCSMMRRPEGAPAPTFSRPYSGDCFGCGVAGHTLRYCPEVRLLCDGIIHIHEDGKVCWDRPGEGGWPARVSRRAPKCRGDGVVRWWEVIRMNNKIYILKNEC